MTITSPEFMTACKMVDRYADDKGSKQYKAASQVLQRSLAGQSARICPRCSGAGGYKHWPGFKCFQCNGSGYLISEPKQSTKEQK